MTTSQAQSLLTNLSALAYYDKDLDQVISWDHVERIIKQEIQK